MVCLYSLRAGERSMKKLSCQNYGLQCNFMTTENVAEKIIQEFREHAMDEHFIDYPDGILMKSLMGEN